MKSILRSVIAGSLLAAAVAAPCIADTVHVEVRGSVEWNQFTFGTFAGVHAGDAVVMQFDLDSNVFMNPPTIPSWRGYAIVQPSFSLSFTGASGTAAVGLLNPMPAGTIPYFFLRNNDPGVDGFVISTVAGGDTEAPLAMVPANYGVAFLRTFSNGTTLPSLNILDALGTWGFENLSVYNFTIQHGENSTPLGILYQSITIRRPCPADFDGNGVVQPADVAAFVNAWAASLNDGTLAGDFDGNGAVQPADVANFVNAWFTALSGGC